MRGLRGQIEAIWRTDTIAYNAEYIDYFDCTLYTLAADQITINREVRKKKYFASYTGVSSGDLPLCKISSLSQSCGSFEIISILHART